MNSFDYLSCNDPLLRTSPVSVPAIDSSVINCTSEVTVQFVDTNVLLYAVSNRPEESVKAEVAREILDRTDIALSTQVLQEFYVQATRPSRSHPLTHEQATGLVEAFSRFVVQDITLTIVLESLTLKARYGLSYWDCAIIEAARAAGCDVVLSEDMSDGQDLDGIHVVNPFADPKS